MYDQWIPLIYSWATIIFINSNAAYSVECLRQKPYWLSKNTVNVFLSIEEQFFSGISEVAGRNIGGWEVNGKKGAKCQKILDIWELVSHVCF